MNLQVKYTISDESEGLNNLFRAWKTYIGNTYKRDHELMYDDGDNLVTVSSDGLKGVIVLHNEDGDSIKLDDKEAIAFAEHANTFFLRILPQLQAVTSFSIKALAESETQQALTEPDFVTEEVLSSLIDELVAEDPELAEDPKRLEEMALARLEQKPKITRVRREGIPVRGRYLPQYPDGKPWEQTPQWKEEIERLGLTSADSLPKGMFNRHYDPFKRKTPSFIKSQQVYSESELGKIQHKVYAQNNPANLDTYSEEFLASLTEEEYNRTGPDALINPRFRAARSSKGQTARKKSIERIDARDKRYDVLQKVYLDAGVPPDDYEIKKQLWLERFYPRQESYDPATGQKGPVDIQRFDRWYNSERTSRG